MGNEKKKKRRTGQGSLFLPVNGRGEEQETYWYKFGYMGKIYQGSTKTRVYKDAQDVMAKRVREVKSGLVRGQPDKVKVRELKEIQEKQYDLDGLRTKNRLIQYWEHLGKFFDLDTKAVDIHTTRLDDYAVKRLADGAARQTVNNELSALRRAFTLAMQKGLLVTMPVFNLPKVLNARTGFFEEGEFAAVLLELAMDVLRDFVQFLRATGDRKSVV